MTLFQTLISALVFLLLLVGNVSGLIEEEDRHHHEPQQRQLLQGDNNVLVEAFLCNADNFKISDDQAVVNKGDSVRICIKTHVRAKVQGITIAKMIDFFFVREFDNAATMEQTLLQNGVVTNTNNDELTCQPGAELCVLETLPMDSLFGRDGRVSAIGSLLLQYDDGSIDIYRTAMPTVVSTAAPTMAPIGPSTVAPTATSPQNNNNTATETTEAPTSAPPQNDTTTPLLVVVTPQSVHHNRQLVLEDPKKIVETSFAVATDGNGTGFLAHFREHWDSSPTYVKVLYVFAFIFFFLILFGLGFGLLLWAGFCGNARELLLPERFHHRGEQGSAPGSKTRGDDGTMDESVGAFSPFARNHIQQEGALLEEEDQYDDEPEPMPKQIFLQRPMSSSLGRTDIEAPGPGDAVAGRKRQPRWDPVRGKSIREGRRSIRDRSLAQKARMARSRQGTNVNPNRDLAASFLQGFPKKKIASVRTKTPRSVHDRNRQTMRTNNSVHEIPREKTATGVRWLQEKDQHLQQQSTHSASSRASSQRRGVNQQQQLHQGSTHGSSGFVPRRGGIVLHGNSIPKPTAQRRPTPPNPAPRRPTPPKPAFSRGFPVIPEDASVTDEESSPSSDNFDVDESSSPPTVLDSSSEIPHGTKENPRPID